MHNQFMCYIKCAKIYLSILICLFISGISAQAQCTGPAVTITASHPQFGQGETILTSGLTGISYQWQIENVDIPGANEKTYIPVKRGNYSVKVTGSDGCLSISPQEFVSGLRTNYVITNKIIKPGVKNSEQIPTLRAGDLIQSISYIDGLGRNVQDVVTQGSPGKWDAVRFTVRDAANRVPIEYLPFTVEENDGSNKPNLVTAQAAFYQNLKGDNMAFAETRYDNSPENRIVEYGKAGAAWQIGTGHTTKLSYRANVNGEVRTWNYDAATQTASSTAAYFENELYVTERVGEEGQKNIEYVNKSQQVICSKSQKTPGDENSYLYTYFVYDDFGNLRYTISPEAVNNLAAVNYTFSYNDAFCKKWIYTCDYDELKRPIVKRKPGAGEEYFVYDSRGRQVFFQNAVLRSKQQWLATLYDELSREVITGILSSNASRTAMQTAVDIQTADPSGPGSTVVADLTLDQPSTGVFQASNSITCIDGMEGNPDFTAEITSPGSDPQLTIMEGVVVNKNPLPANTPFEVLTVKYFDDYNWVAGTGTTLDARFNTLNAFNKAYFLINSNAPLYAQLLVPNYHVRGKPTGGKVKVLGTASQYLYAVVFYDNEGRELQVQSINQSGGKNMITNQYDFDGKLLRQLKQYQKKASGPGTNDEYFLLGIKNEYYPNGLLKSVVNNMDGIGEHLIASYTYSETGEIKQKSLGSFSGSLNYEYNIRGWLTTINKEYLQATDNSILPNTWFGMELAYENPVSVVANTSYDNPRYNGVISGTTWKTRGSGVKRKIDYTYDNFDRLTSATFKEQFGATWANTDPGNSNFTIDFSEGGKGSSNKFIEYDDNGNIKNAWRKGLKVNSSSYIDALDYQYDGNRLTLVTDAHSDPDTKLGDFHDGTNSGDDYTYDAGGNVIKDENKRIGNITYNFQNLPELITFLDNNGNQRGTISYTYDANGNKLQKVVVDNSTPNKTVTTTSKYLNDGVYESRTTVNPAPDDPADYADKLQYVSNSNGRIRPVPPPSGGCCNTFAYDFFITDQVGNVRMILTEEQKVHAYPMATMEDVADKNNLEDENNYVPYYANTDYTIDAGVRTATNSIPGYPALSESGMTDPNNYVAKLDGDARKIGPSIVLRVMANDYVNIQADCWYKTNGATPDVPTNPLTDIVAALANGIGNLPGAKVSAGDLQNGVLSPNIFEFLSDKTVDANRPKAYLNWVLLDDQFRYVAGSSSFKQVPAESEFQYNGSPMAKWLIESGVRMEKSGYLYVYVSNETPNINVYFDDLQVTQEHGLLLEENHYYAMGMPMAGICSRALTGLAANKLKYQGQEYEDALGLNSYEFEARIYDPQLGRWHVPDPANQFASPYQAMGNNWPSVTDPDGKFAPLVAAAIGMAIASASYVGSTFAAGGTWKDMNFKDWSKAALMGAVSGAIGGGFSMLGDLLPQAVANSIGYGILTNVATQMATDVVFGNEITLGSVAGAVVGGMLDGAIPKFKGFAHKGSYDLGDYLMNGLGDLTSKTFKGGIIGGIGGGISAAIDGRDIGEGMQRGAVSGAISGGIRGAFTMAIMGTPIRPKGNAELQLKTMETEKNIQILKGAGTPVFRTGVFPFGLALGGDLMVGTDTESEEGVYLWVHESYHYYQQINAGIFKQMKEGAKEQAKETWSKITNGETQYRTKDTYENDAHIYATDASSCYPSRIKVDGNSLERTLQRYRH